MRITNNMMTARFMSNLNRIMNKMDKAQEKLASGKSINMPSDNPTGTARSMQLRTNLVETDQYKINTDYATSWAESAESALSNTTDIMQRVRELAVQGTNGVLAQDSRDAIGSEVEQIRKQLLLELGNASNGGRFIFAGAKTTEAPFQEMTPDKLITLSIPPSNNNTVGKPIKPSEIDLASGGGTKSFTIAVGDYSKEITINLTGTETNAQVLSAIKDGINAQPTLDSTPPGTTIPNPLIGKIEIANYQDKIAGQNYTGIKINSPVPFEIKDTAGNLIENAGAGRKEIRDIIGYNGDDSKLYVQVGTGNINMDINVPGGEPFVSNIAATINLRNALMAGDQTKIGQSLGIIDKAMEVTLTQRADLGARTNRLDLIKNRLEELDLNFNKLLSNNEDTDIAEVITDLKMQESVQRAALSVGARIIQPSLVDFLR